MVKRFAVYLFVALSFASCGDYADVDCENWDYSSCLGEEPLDGNIEVLTTIYGDTGSTPLYIFIGKMGNIRDTVFAGRTWEAVTYFELPVNEDYFAMAIYEKNGKVIRAVDGQYFYSKDTRVCDTICWSLKGDVLDVRLKNP